MEVSQLDDDPVRRRQGQDRPPDLRLGFGELPLEQRWREPVALPCVPPSQAAQRTRSAARANSVGSNWPTRCRIAALC